MVRAIARTSDPETSHDAADSLASEKISRCIRTAIEIFTKYDRLTDFELATVWPQFWNEPFSESLPRKARHWARQQGRIEHKGYKVRKNGRRVRAWGLV